MSAQWRGCSAATSTTLDGGDHRVGAFNSIAIPADGLPVVAYWDQTAFALKVAKCARPGCSDGVLHPRTDRVGRFGSIAIGADGLPILSYQNATVGALMAAKCRHPGCATN